MQKDVIKAIELRHVGKAVESNESLLKVVQEFPTDPYVNYQCAWSFDLLGKETEAIPFYEKSIDMGLSGKDLEGAILGLGSSYRTIGEYAKSKNVFQKGLDLFPSNRALKVFYSMTLYNLKEHNTAMEILLTSLIETTSDEDILHYKRAIQFYSDKLDKTWK
ncbi:tetratricopeptide (TPR) repeat protein [Neobacillus niacini]|uniref:tetratricopeptide repeat protein n=1 Tax=Neobacillus driksii TaxID=3035913 RepID=UPI002784EDB2|nr:tetratricopeptide repeat protein [Neobacillus niacini]MDQ0974556.1 tetratricopeptide (TPR) repeat protein [Neobacillus niacini]